MRDSFSLPRIGDSVAALSDVQILAKLSDKEFPLLPATVCAEMSAIAMTSGQSQSISSPGRDDGGGVVVSRSATSSKNCVNDK